MPNRCVVASLSVLALGIGAMGLAHAQDAPFGCKVLLCAAATNPSWQGIPYCVPPMTDLMNILSHGGSWPTCDGAGEDGGLDYQPYDPCPTDKSAYNAQGYADANGTICARRVLHAQPNCKAASTGGTTGDGRGGGGSLSAACTPIFVDQSDRPLSATPYSVQITSNGGTKTIRFNLKLN